MLTREKVLVELANKEAIRIGRSLLHKIHISGGFICAEDTVIWRVYTWEDTEIEYCEEDLLEAVDMFINCQPDLGTEFPDADELRESNKQVAEAEYNQWCEEHSSELRIIAESICELNLQGLRTIEFNVPLNGTEGNYRRYFTERHYKVTIQKYNSNRAEKRGLMLCKLDWS